MADSVKVRLAEESDDDDDSDRRLPEDRRQVVDSAMSEEQQDWRSRRRRRTRGRRRSDLSSEAAMAGLCCVTLCRCRCSSLFFCLIAVSVLLFLVFDALLPHSATTSASRRRLLPAVVRTSDAYEQDIDRRSFIDPKSGVHVIVGHFVAAVPADPDSDFFRRLQEEKRENGSSAMSAADLESLGRTYDGYAAIPGSGEDGVPVFIPSFLEDKSRLLHTINRFNLLASDRISIDRRLPDVRRQECKERFPASDDAGRQDGRQRLTKTAAVVIVFHNEAFSTLLRSVHSIARTASPRELLRRVVLVDDASDRLFLTDGRLRTHLQNLTRDSKAGTHFSLVRQSARRGLVAARLAGAKVATSEDILIFLDAHIEATTGWLAPLISTIQSEERTVVCPVIDVIDEQTFAYARTFDRHIGGFNWNLHFRWFPSPARQESSYDQPFETPVMAGGLFAIDRRLFWDLGSYDEGMLVWGGENIEMSLRLWMCGARLVIHPCSHIGHVFRRSSPYSFATNSSVSNSVSGVLFANLGRVVDVWTDDHAPFFRFLNPGLGHGVSDNGTARAGDQVLESRRQVRRRLGGCHSFQWFLQSVWGNSHFFPSPFRRRPHHRDGGAVTDDGGKKVLVQIQSLATGLCVEQETTSGGSSGANGQRLLLSLQRCAIEGNFSPQLFVYDSRFRVLQSDDSLCVDVLSSSRRPNLFMNACDVLSLFSPQDRRRHATADNKKTERRANRQSFWFSGESVSVAGEKAMMRRRRIVHQPMITDHHHEPLFANGLQGEKCVTVEPNSRKLLSIADCDLTSSPREDQALDESPGKKEYKSLQDFVFLPVDWHSNPPSK